MKKKFYGALSLIVLAPLLPFVFVNIFGEWLMKFTDWCCEDRKWSVYLINLAERIEMKTWR